MQLCVGFDSGEGHGASGGRGWGAVAGSASACGGGGAAAGMARLAQGAVVLDRDAAAGELGVARLGGDAGVCALQQDQRLDRILQSPCRQIRTGTSPFLLKRSSPRTIQVHCAPVVLLFTFLGTCTSPNTERYVVISTLSLQLYPILVCGMPAIIIRPINVKNASEDSQI